MASNTVPKPKASAQARNLLLLSIVLILGAAIWFFFLRGPATPPQPPGLSPEAKAYVRNLGLSGVSMQAKESYMKNTLLEINGQLTNKGGRPLRLVEINCVFTDPYGQLLLRERVAIVRRSAAGPLKPGETRSFRLPFDNVPEGWNQMLPQLVIANIEFDD
ncbi:MAG: hypothetical protein HY821_00875 [Acidobacteria bacterium]|nr:hypothetical protein [Acidobacteriota bacterium]